MMLSLIFKLLYISAALPHLEQFWIEKQKTCKIKGSGPKEVIYIELKDSTIKHGPLSIFEDILALLSNSHLLKNISSGLINRPACPFSPLDLLISVQ